MKQEYDPVWKRWKTVPSAVEDAANVMSGYETQLSLNLNKPADSTPEEAQEWYVWFPFRGCRTYPNVQPTKLQYQVC